MRKPAKLFTWQRSFLLLVIIWLSESQSAPSSQTEKDTITTPNVGTTEGNAGGISIYKKIYIHSLKKLASILSVIDSNLFCSIASTRKAVRHLGFRILSASDKKKKVLFQHSTKTPTTNTSLEIPQSVVTSDERTEGSTLASEGQYVSKNVLESRTSK